MLAKSTAMEHRALLSLLVVALVTFSACVDLQLEATRASSAGPAPAPPASSVDGGTNTADGPETDGSDHHAFSRSLDPVEACRAVLGKDPSRSRLDGVACLVEPISTDDGPTGPMDFALVRADDSWWQSLAVVWNGGGGTTEVQVIFESWPNINGAEALEVVRAEVLSGGHAAVSGGARASGRRVRVRSTHRLDV